MSAIAIKSWQDAEKEILHRINSRLWKPGDNIPNEVELAREFGCARTTVNRALRAIAESGLLERKRKAGTRVAPYPVRKATFSIPIIRREIEDRNQRFSYALIDCNTKNIPTDIRACMQIGADKALHIRALYLADGKPYVFEDRWVNVDEVPEILNVNLAHTNANEWLISNAPYTHGDFTFSAIKANDKTAEIMGSSLGDALFSLNRTTWNGQQAVTSVKLIYQLGYNLHTSM